MSNLQALRKAADEHADVQARRPAPAHRHAQPSAPWPWINIHDKVDETQLASEKPPIPALCDHVDCGGCWTGYPQSRFPNWTESQVKRAQIYDAIHDYQRDIPSVIHHVDINNEGYFTDADKLYVYDNDKSRNEFWETLVKNERPADIRVRALFIEHMTGPVLQMLGAKYNIEPFFFSSSLSWIPSRFQEEVQPGKGDHITVTMTFVRTIAQPDRRSTSNSSNTATAIKMEEEEALPVINTQAPLFLSHEGCYLVLDLLSVHLIRNVEGNTIISYHNMDGDTTTAPYLHERIRFAGQSVYWQNIFQKYPDPTFVLLTFIWHAMYAWDEALERLYTHICWLETQVVLTSDIHLTRELHVVRAHLLHYSSLLEDFRKAVKFVLNTANPAMETRPEEERTFSCKLLEKECENLLIEIERLEKGRSMQDKRLKNVMNLVFSSVNILDSRRMQELTEATVRDSAAMRQIAFLSMIFLPASFVASVFGMNIREIVPQTNGSLAHYFITAIPMTVLTVWIVIAFQSHHLFKGRVTLWMRLLWPYLVARMLLGYEQPSQEQGDKLQVELKAIDKRGTILGLGAVN